MATGSDSSTNPASSSFSPTGAVDAAATAAHGMVDRAVAATTPAARWLEETEHYFHNQFRGTCDYVAAHPVRSLAIAFLAGYLIGKIT
jgi:hypothetical protein